MTQISKALDILTATARPMTHQELVQDIPGSCGETVSRAMRTLFKRGKVTKQPKDPNKPTGTKLWSAKTTITTTQPPSHQSSGKAFSMCLPQNKPTTITASLQALNDLLADKKPFSAHDVTKRLRDLVKDGMVTVDHSENGTVFAYGKNVAKIDHEDVKGIVHEFFNTGKMNGWTRELVNGHWEYKEEVANANPQPPILLVVPVTSGSDYDGDPLL